MFVLVNLGIVLVFLLRIGFCSYNSKSPSNLEFVTGSFLCIGSIGNVLFGSSHIWLFIQAVGLLTGLLQGFTWLHHYNKKA